MVNTLPTEENIQIEINGADKIGRQGRATVLTSGSVYNANSITNPTKVVPVVKQLNNLDSSFAYNFAPHSVTVLQLTTTAQSSPVSHVIVAPATR
jgi:alpha-N-arabinofuranosidase